MSARVLSCAAMSSEQGRAPTHRSRSLTRSSARSDRFNPSTRTSKKTRTIARIAPEESGRQPPAPMLGSRKLCRRSRPPSFLGILSRLNGPAASVDHLYEAAGLPQETRVSLFLTTAPDLRQMNSLTGKERAVFAEAVYRKITVAAKLGGTLGEFDRSPLGRLLKVGIEQH